MSGWVTGVVIVMVAVAAGWFDVRERRIPNALTVSALAIALGLALTEGFAGIGVSLLGAALCLLVALPLYLMRGLGGGDVKLLVAFGALLGPARLLPALLATALVGGAWGLVVMIRKGAVRQTFVNLYLMWQTVRRKIFGRGRSTESSFWMTLDTPGAITVPYGVAISAGAVYAWFF